MKFFSISILETETLTEISEQQKHILRKLDNIMAGQKELDAALDKLATAVSDAATRVQTDLKSLQAKIDAGAAAADLQPEVDKINAGIAAIAAIDPAAPTPVPTPAPTPPSTPTP